MQDIQSSHRKSRSRFFFKRSRVKSSPKVEEPASRSLLNLPAEILLEILSYVSATDEASLALTCHTLYSTLGIKSWDRSDQGNHFTDNEARLNVLRLLHRLQRDAHDRIWLCFSCTRLHPISKSLRPPGDKRRHSNFSFVEEWLTDDCPVRNATECSVVPHGLAVSYMRHYLHPRLPAYVSAGGLPGLFSRSIHPFTWWGYKGLIHEDQEWKPSIGRPSYLGLIKIVTRVWGTKAIVLRFYKYRVASNEPADVYTRMAIDMCAHHFTFPSGDAMPLLAPALRPGWDPAVLAKDGSEAAIQLTSKEGPECMYGVRCGSCATEMHWSTMLGPHRIQSAPFSGQRYIGVVVTHIIETDQKKMGLVGKEVTLKNPWARRDSAAMGLDERSEPFRLRKQMRTDVAEFFDLRDGEFFSKYWWKYGWPGSRPNLLMDMF